jgi:hypothetical protein
MIATKSRKNPQRFRFLCGFVFFRRQFHGIDKNVFKLSDTRAEHNGYLAAVQTRDGRIHLITSKNHYVFNLAWLTQPPPLPIKR